MWRSDRLVAGPLVATREDIDALNRVFSDAFTERYRRDGLAGIRVPFLNPVIWQYAIADAGAGAMVWRDTRGELIAFNMVHRSGSEGWMGPLAVRTDRQARGEGKNIVSAGVAWLQSQGARTIGLETMPRTTENIGFYSQLGFVPSHLTITLQHEHLTTDGDRSVRLSTLDAEAQQQAIRSCRDAANRAAPGIDFTREIELTLELRLGDVTLHHNADGVVHSFALWHTASLAQGRNRDEVRILKLVAPDATQAMDLIRAVEREAAFANLGRLALRCQTRQSALYTCLIEDGYRVHWTDLRMTLAGYPEVEPQGVLLSNWEI